MASSSSSALLLTTTCLLSVISRSTAFVHPPSQPASPFRIHATENGGDPDAILPPPEETAFEEQTNENKDAATAAAGIVGISGLGAVASTVSTAGGVCAGGACVAGGAAATSGAAATTAGGLLAGAKALLVGGALAAGVALNTLTGTSPPDSLQTMISSSTPLSVLFSEGKGRPTVLEFYGSACPRCRDIAAQLIPIEESSLGKGFNWVMVDTDDPSMEPLWEAYRVYELPHFEFLDGEGRVVGYEVGEVGVERIRERIVQLAARGGGVGSSSLSTANVPDQ